MQGRGPRFENENGPAEAQTASARTTPLRVSPDGSLRKRGRIAIRRGPIAYLSHVQADARLSLERDLRDAPTPISGGMRKALHKEQRSQGILRRRNREPHGSVAFRRCYGLMLTDCPGYFCRHPHFFDEVDFDAPPPLCDRCKRPLWPA